MADWRALPTYSSMKSVPLIGKVSATAGLGWVWVDMGSEHAGLARIYTAPRSPRRHGSRREAPQGPWRPGTFERVVAKPRRGRGDPAHSRESSRGPAGAVATRRACLGASG